MILIIGAGLSGLITAYRLKSAAIPFKIIEARSRIGGRINTIYRANQAPLEMGATWFYDQHEEIIALLTELEIDYFEQRMDSTVFYQQHASRAAELTQIPRQATSYRIAGGTSNLVYKLHQKLDSKDVFLNEVVREIKWNGNSVHVISNQTFEGSRVVLAIPPKLWAKKISFNPPLPENLMKIAKNTHTWMEDSIKIGISYGEPFWQKEQKPATLFSNVGPITEFYDHSDYTKTKFALCGFMKSDFKRLTSEQRKEHILHQIAALYGQKALNYLAYEECIWSEEENTFGASEAYMLPHQNNGNPIFRKSFCEDTLFVSSSESALRYPGYMDGAVQIGNEVAEKIIAIHQMT
jgi:monoamine oxidase